MSSYKPHPNHLTLGVTREGVEEFERRIGFPQSYKRDESRFHWITETYGTTLTGYDFCAAVQQYLRTNGFEHLSAAELMWNENSPHVGPADAFLSHMQIENVRETYRAMNSAPIMHDSLKAKKGSRQLAFYFLDYITLRQCLPDFDLPKVINAIDEIGMTVAHCNPSAEFLRRSFCVFEAFATVKCQKPLLIVFDAQSTMAYCARGEALPAVDVKSAQTHSPADKVTIDEYIDGVGEDVVNTTVFDAMTQHVEEFKAKTAAFRS
eukprot:TRINITY_DN77310_c0_g1_i1.p1 TRINITY_DN77310_c0_g1~~TRINITY_DN77310_c0_g1_i1.p1  ORF type:complete len:264 (+),score=31.76 TRINITY_DN77310_c0_g1_i1:76-867(+)